MYRSPVQYIVAMHTRWKKSDKAIEFSIRVDFFKIKSITTNINNGINLRIAKNFYSVYFINTQENAYSRKKINYADYLLFQHFWLKKLKLQTRKSKENAQHLRNCFTSEHDSDFNRFFCHIEATFLNVY